MRPIVGRNGCLEASEDPYPMNDEARKAAIESHFAAIMNILGLDLKDDSLIDTPRRVAKMFVDEIFYGLDYAKFPKCTTVANAFHFDEMVLERNISVMCTCEHHFQNIVGKAHVAYIPGSKVLGLSKLNRIVEMMAKRPSVQERLTMQIYHTLQYILGTDDIAVVIDADHHCVKARGVKDEGSSTVTSKLGGVFSTNPSTRAEFMRLIPNR